MVRTLFNTSIKELHSDILRMGSKVEKQLYLAVESLEKQDKEMALKVIKGDDIVDKMQKVIDDKCVKLLVMQQPLFATDLRDVFTATKTIADLERMADHAVDIAKITVRLIGETYIKELNHIGEMALIVRTMIKESLDAYVSRDLEKAMKVCEMDNEVDAIYKQVFNELLATMQGSSAAVYQGAQLLFVCKFLERVADHATNICEATIYLVTGEYIDLNE
jgi:phosphate transport system protein